MLTVSQDGRELKMRLEDDGVGLSGCVGNGLLGMTERVKQQGGRMSVSAGAGRGTVLAVMLPVDVAEVANPALAAARRKDPQDLFGERVVQQIAESYLRSAPVFSVVYGVHESAGLRL